MSSCSLCLYCLRCSPSMYLWHSFPPPLSLTSFQWAFIWDILAEAHSHESFPHFLHHVLSYFPSSSPCYRDAPFCLLRSNYHVKLRKYVPRERQTLLLQSSSGGIRCPHLQELWDDRQLKNTQPPWLDWTAQSSCIFNVSSNSLTFSLLTFSLLTSLFHQSLNSSVLWAMLTPDFS